MRWSRLAKWIIPMMIFILCLCVCALAEATVTGSGTEDDPWLVYSWGDLVGKIDETGYVKLMEDCIAPDTAFMGLYIRGYKNCVLDLNGKKIDRNLYDGSAAKEDGYVIKVEGTLTIIDSGSAGVITGGWNSNGAGGIIVLKMGTLNLKGGLIYRNKSESGAGGVSVNEGIFTMTGGTISGNISTKGAGGVYNAGTFEMSGGTIQSNTAAGTGTASWGGGVNNQKTFTMSGNSLIKYNSAPNGKGGGVYQGWGTFTMNGGSIISNDAVTGGGVYCENGSLKMSGNSEITRNKNGTDATAANSNVYLPDGKVVTVSGELNSTARIGVTTETAPTTNNYTAVTSGLASKGSALNFTTDAQTYSVGINSSGEAVLVAQNEYLITYNFNGGSGYAPDTYKPAGTAIQITDQVPTLNHHTFMGWSTDQNATTGEYLPKSSFNIDQNTTLYAIWKDAYDPGTLRDGSQFTVSSYQLHYGPRMYAKIVVDQSGFYCIRSLNNTYDGRWGGEGFYKGSSHICDFDYIVTAGTVDADNDGVMDDTFRDYSACTWLTAGSVYYFAYMDFKDRDMTIKVSKIQDSALSIGNIVDEGTFSETNSPDKKTSLFLSFTVNEEGYYYIKTTNGSKNDFHSETNSLFTMDENYTIDRVAAGSWTSDKSNLTLSANLEAGVTYYIKYYDVGYPLNFLITNNVYTLTYNFNGGTGYAPSVCKLQGETIYITDQIPTLDPKTFMGWNTDATANAGTYLPKDPFSLDENTTLYAIWHDPYDPGLLTSGSLFIVPTYGLEYHPRMHIKIVVDKTGSYCIRTLEGAVNGYWGGEGFYDENMQRMSSFQTITGKEDLDNDGMPDSYTDRAIYVDLEAGRTYYFAYMDHMVTNVPISVNEIISTGDHRLVRNEMKKATHERAGYEAYWECLDCGKLYADAQGPNEIEAPVAIPALPAIADISMDKLYTESSITATVAGCMPENAGTLTFTAGTPEVTTGSATTVSAFSVDGDGNVTASFENGVAGTVITLPVTIGSDRYADTTVNVVVTLCEKEEVECILETGIISDISFNLLPGETATMVVEASSNEEISYQWCLAVGGPAGKAIDGATSASFNTGKAGKYFCRVSTNSKYQIVGTFYVTVENNLLVSPVGDTSFTPDPDEDITLQVSASCSKGSLTYSWYKRTRTPELIYLGNGNTYTGKKNANYQCTVEDEYGNSESVYFSVDNNFEIDPSGRKDIGIEKGQNVTLEVKAKSLSNQFTYEWGKPDRVGRIQIIDGETSSTLLVENVTEEQEYYCYVIDEYDNTRTVVFYITTDGEIIESNLVASAKGDTSVCVNAGEKAVLEVDATSNGHISYQWYTFKLSPRGEIIEGETTSRLETLINGSYECRVSDDLGGQETIRFTVEVANEISVTAPDNSEFDYEPDKEISLSVSATCAVGSLHYQWYKMGRVQLSSTGSIYNWESGERIECTGNTLTAKRDSGYVCLIEDDFGHATWTYFFVNTHTSIKPIGKTNLMVEKGSTITLSVEAICPYSSFSYQWKTDRGTPGPSEDIENETKNTITIDDIQENKNYYCVVNNDFNEWCTVRFVVQIEDAHTEIIDVGRESTCTETGLTEGKHCSSCGKVLVAQETIPAKGHTPVTDAAKEATCTETGLTEGSHCSVCGTVIKAQETIPAKGHTPVTDAAKEATCTETGLTEGSHCSVCGTVIKAQGTIPAKEHTPVTDAAKTATCTEPGLTEGAHCSTCNAVLVKQETVPARGHTPVTDIAVAATCTETGLTEGSHCSVCNAVLVKQEVTTALGHDWDAGVVTKEATVKEEGVRTFTCTRCGEKKEEAIAKLEIQAGWQETDAGRVYVQEDGTKATDWVQIDGSSYCFDENGVMRTGWYEENGYTFYLGTDGKMATGDTEIDGKVYHFNDGGACTGEVPAEPDESTDPDARGWIRTNGGWAYIRNDGTKAAGWLLDGSTWYYMNDAGVMQTGWVLDSGSWYYMESSGAMATGWIFDGAWYYMNPSGAMATGWVFDGGVWYYMKSSGAMATGWVYDGGAWYYMKDSGAMATGWIFDGSAWYYMSSSGAMLTGWITDGSTWYYMKPSGAMQTGWFEDKEAEGRLPAGQERELWYWFDDSGAMAIGWKLINNQWEMFADSGEWLYTYDGK